MQRGEVWWLERPDEKARPALVMSRPEILETIDQVLVAPITRKVRNIVSELPLGPDDGLATDCVANFDQIGPVRKSHLTTRITTLSIALMFEACERLAAATACGRGRT